MLCSDSILAGPSIPEGSSGESFVYLRMFVQV
jgi:hypothetical protein